MKRAVLVNGVPASGKSSCARRLGRRLGVPVLELDAVKEVLFEEIGHREGDREWGRTLSRASLGSIWSLLGGFPRDALVIVEAWFRRPPHDHILRGLEQAGVDRWVEVWCHAHPDVLVERYAARRRHPGHPAPADYLDELRELAGVAEPMALSPVLELDTGTARRPDIQRAARWVEEHLPPTS